MSGFRCGIAVMAKAPQAGRAKTRLVPPLDYAAAAALSAAFLRDTTENIALAARDAPIAGYAAYAPSGAEPLFDGILADGTALVLADGSPAMPPLVQRFGRSLLHAMQAVLADGCDAACLLNSDGPTLPTALLARAAHVLAAPGERVVLGPAEDGGYYLIGAKQAYARLFEDIDWSTERVAAQTRARIASLGLELVELPPWYDVDDRASLLRLMADLALPDSGAPEHATPYSAPATAACVRRLGIAARLAEAA